MNALQLFIWSRPGGFIVAADVPDLIALDRLCPLLVRCGGCRFTCAAQDLEHLKAAIRAVGDYVRDVSFPVGSVDRAAEWRPPLATPQHPVAVALVLPSEAPKAPRRSRSYGPVFNEADCGGVYDGYGVTSDADPGL